MSKNKENEPNVFRTLGTICLWIGVAILIGVLVFGTTSTEYIVMDGVVVSVTPFDPSKPEQATLIVFADSRQVKVNGFVNDDMVAKNCFVTIKRNTYLLGYINGDYQFEQSACLPVR